MDSLAGLRRTFRFVRHVAGGEAVLHPLRAAAAVTAYAIAVLLATVWIVSALESLTLPLLDLGRAGIGDAIIAFAARFALPPQAIFQLAHLLVGIKFLVGLFLLAAIVVGMLERLLRAPGDETLDLALFVSAVASVVAASPLLADTHAQLELVGELMLCLIASLLTGFARRGPIAEPATRVSYYPTLSPALPFRLPPR